MWNFYRKPSHLILILQFSILNFEKRPMSPYYFDNTCKAVELSWFGKFDSYVTKLELILRSKDEF